MKLTFLAAALAVFTGCAVVTDPAPATRARIQPPPPMPPLDASRSFAAQPTTAATVFAVVAPEPITTNRLYISNGPSGPYLWWLTNGLKNYVLTSTNYTLNLQQWEPLSSRTATIDGGVASIPILNRTAQQRYYRLLSVPTNHIVICWQYSFQTNTAGFKLHRGWSSGAYTNFLSVNGRWLWSTYPVTETNLAFYSVTAYNFDGVESEFGNEVSYRPLETTDRNNRP